MHVERETLALMLSKPAGDPLISAVGEGSPRWISAAAEHPGAEEDDGIEFAFVVGDPELGPDITVADDIFSDGRIRPVYPVFNRDLLQPDSSSSSSSKAVLIEDRVSTSSSTGVVGENSPAPYCVWTPRSVPSSPDRCKKSSSTGTGTAPRPWRLRDVFDGRSHSDGKEKFVFLAPPEKEKRPDPSASPSRETAAKAKGKGTAKANGKGEKLTEMDMVTAHRLYYSKGGAGGGGVAGARRSFLPYKRNLGLGFFVNSNPF